MPPARSAPAAPRRSRQTRPETRPRRVAPRGSRRVRWDRVGRVGMLVVLAVVASLYVQHALSYLSTRSQAGQQQSIVNRLTRENARLAREQRSLGDPATIQEDARSLGMVKAGEQPYTVMGLPKH